ncbi:MAG: hypothetical protein IJR66_01495 [Clostridia bacterium]|nr:hypothetical protein [Clostridia bacterium]
MEKRSLPNFLIEYLIYYLLIQGFLISVLHFPSMMQYLMDIVVIFLLFYSILFLPRLKALFKIKPINTVFRYVAFFIVLMLLSALLHFVPVFQVLWAVRNNVFYLLFFVFSIMYLRFSDAKRIMNNLMRFQVINVICALFEFFVLHLSGDFCGGMFGIIQGCNGPLNIYLMIISAFMISCYLNKKTSIINTLIILASSLLVATIAELKVFYFEIALIFILQLFLSGETIKGFLIFVFLILGTVITLNIYRMINPIAYKVFSGFDSLFAYGSESEFGYGTIVPRIGFASFINRSFFKGNLWLNLFGFGFGFCEDSRTFELFNSEFATKYASMQYRGISSSMTFLETGYVGLISLIALFIVIFIVVYKLKGVFPNHKHVVSFTLTLSVILLLNIFYNSDIREYVAYLSYFALSVFFVMVKELYIKKELLKRERLRENL